MSASWCVLSPWFRSKLAKSPVTRPARPRRVCLRLEVLEDRCVPALIVDSLADVVNPSDGQLTLREAIANAAQGETIQFSVQGTINMDQALGKYVISKNLTIEGPGADKLTIDGQGG